MLLLFASLSVTNAVLWISFAPIQSLTSTYYNISTSEVNMLSLVFLILYLPGSLAAAAVFHKYGLKVGVVVGGTCNLIGAILRYVSAGDAHTSREYGYTYLLIGQCIAALAQPFFTNVPAKLAGVYHSLLTDVHLIGTSISSFS
jgi:FLVCR family MFS transporter 7